MSFTKTVSMLLVAGFASAALAQDARIAQRHDDVRKRGWVLVKSGVVVQQAGRTLRVPLPDWIYAGMPFGCPPDLGVGGAGEAVVTSDVLPVVWRVDPVSFTVTRHELALDADRGKDMGFTGLSWNAQRGMWLAFSTADGALWTIDAGLKTARKLTRGSFGDGCAARGRVL